MTDFNPERVALLVDLDIDTLQMFIATADPRPLRHLDGRRLTAEETELVLDVDAADAQEHMRIMTRRAYRYQQACRSAEIYRSYDKGARDPERVVAARMTPKDRAEFEACLKEARTS